MSALRLLLVLVILMVIYVIGLSVLASHGLAARPEATAVVWALEFQVLLATWVRMDRRHRDVSLPFEFDAFVFFGWPVVVPYYLYRTRGIRGLIMTVAIYTLFVTPAVISAIVRLTV